MKYSIIVFLSFFILNVQSQTISLIDYVDSTNVSEALIYIEHINSNNSYTIFSNEYGYANIQKNEPFFIKLRHFSYQDYKDTITSFNDTLIISMIPSYLSIDEVVITDQINASSTSNAVNNIISIPKEKITQTGANNLSQLLSQNALFNINYDSAFGSSISIQGIQGNNVNILIDGIPVIGRKGSQIDLGQLNLTNVSSVEILKGPASVSYGTNSTGGVINLITKRNNIKDNIQIDSYFENIGVMQMNLNVDKSLSNHHYNFNFGKYNFNGLGVDSLRSKKWSSKSQYYGEVNWNIKYLKSDIYIKSRFFNEKIISLGNENFTPFNGTANDNHFETYRTLNYLKFNHKDDNKIFKSLFSFSNTIFSKSQFLVDLVNNTSTQTLDNNYNAKDTFQTFYSRIEYNIDNSDSKHQFGLDLYKELVSGSKIINNLAEIYKIALFSKFEADLNKMTKLQLGVRLPYHSKYEAPISPSLHFKFGESESFQLRCSYARGFRAPTIKELFMEFIDLQHYIYGNPELDAEYSHSFQASTSFLGFQNKHFSLNFDYEAFINLLENKISLIEIDDILAPITPWMYYNVSKSKYYGFKFGFNSKTMKYGDCKFNWNRYHIESVNIEDRILRQNFSIDYTYESVKLNTSFNINWKLNGKSEYQSLQNNVIVNYFQESYQLMNANIYTSFEDIKLSVGIGVKNIFNIEDIESISEGIIHSSNNQLISWGRTGYVNLKYTMF